MDKKTMTDKERMNFFIEPSKIEFPVRLIHSTHSKKKKTVALQQRVLLVCQQGAFSHCEVTFSQHTETFLADSFNMCNKSISILR